MIAVEGRETERKYFDRLRQKPYNYSVTLVPRDWDRTEPEAILNDIVKFRSQQENSRKKMDKYWIVFDHDNNSDHKLKQVFRNARKNGVCIADSNPCFEVWLFQHFSSLKSVKRLIGDVTAGGCDRIISELKKKRHDPNYSKSNYDVDKYLKRINDALINSSEDDSNDDEFLTQFTGSRVYKLVDSIINSAT